MQKGPWMDFWGGYPVEKHESHVHYLQRYQEWLDDGKPAPKVLEEPDASEKSESKPEDKSEAKPGKKFVMKKATKSAGDSEKAE